MLEFVGKGVSLLFIQFNRVSERVHDTDHHDALIIPNLYELVLADSSSCLESSRTLCMASTPGDRMDDIHIADLRRLALVAVKG